MKKLISILACTFSCIVCLSFLATAQQTKKISLQGFLKDANGKAVADGPQDITFKLYTVAAGGDVGWTDTQTINVYGGVYSTHLGSTTNPVDRLNWGSATYFVGVTVQGVELTPRTELTFAPYSLGSPKAIVADTATVVKCSGALGDVKYSILDPIQFAKVNGDCWIPMDGRTIKGSKLSAILDITKIADAGGVFLRGQEFSTSADNDPDRASSSPIAMLQDDAFKSHNHGSLEYSKDALVPFSIGAGLPLPLPLAVIGSTLNTGDKETRPKNLNLWTYIRIN
jgi:hypothetical protein